jgi:hypothetical protein
VEEEIANALLLDKNDIQAFIQHQKITMNDKIKVRYDDVVFHLIDGGLMDCGILCIWVLFTLFMEIFRFSPVFLPSMNSTGLQQDIRQ